MGCCSKLARMLIGTINLVVLVAVGVASVLVYKNINAVEYFKLFKSSPQFKIMIAVIVVVVVSAIVGFLLFCCGDSKCFRVTYLILLIIVIAVEVSAVVISVQYTDKTMDFAEKEWKENKNLTKKAEEALHCCGFSNINTTRFDDCGYVNHTVETPTCFELIKDKVNENSKYVFYGCLIALIIEFLLIAYSFYWACCYVEPKEEYQDITYH